jgi:hypothetical protein
MIAESPLARIGSFTATARQNRSSQRRSLAMRARSHSSASSILSNRNDLATESDTGEPRRCVNAIRNAVGSRRRRRRCQTRMFSSRSWNVRSLTPSASWRVRTPGRFAPQLTSSNLESGSLGRCLKPVPIRLRSSMIWCGMPMAASSAAPVVAFSDGSSEERYRRHLPPTG